MSQLTCVCGVSYWPAQRWIHEKCKEAINTPQAINKESKPAINSDRSPNRRSRMAYNEYMRAYMRAYRAKHA